MGSSFPLIEGMLAYLNAMRIPEALFRKCAAQTRLNPGSREYEVVEYFEARGAGDPIETWHRISRDLFTEAVAFGYITNLVEEGEVSLTKFVITPAGEEAYQRLLTRAGASPTPVEQ